MKETLILDKLENPYFLALRGEMVTMESINQANPLLCISVEQLIRRDKLAAQYGLDGKLYIYRPESRLKELTQSQPVLPSFYKRNGHLELDKLGVPKADGYWRKL